MHRWKVVIGLVALVVLGGVLSAPAAASVGSQDEQAILTLQDVKDRLKQNERFLNQAKQRGKAGDAPGLQTALENFSRGTEGLDRALEGGRFRGTEAEREEAFDRVERATRKHGEVLTDLQTRVPEQARPAIEHALEVSQRGRQTALTHIEQARARRAASGLDRTPGRSDAAGRPSIGPGSQPGRPSGVGGGPSRPAGPPAGKPPGAGRP